MRWRARPPRGASTITMQTVKNLYLWTGRFDTVRKVVELPLAVYFDLVVPKRRIMEIYLNIAEWGPNIYGIEAAAQHHFGRLGQAADAAPGGAARGDAAQSARAQPGQARSGAEAARQPRSSGARRRRAATSAASNRRRTGRRAQRRKKIVCGAGQSAACRV